MSILTGQWISMMKLMKLNNMAGNNISMNSKARRDHARTGFWTGWILPVLMATLVGATLISCGITAPRGDAGYANLDSPGMFDTDRTTSLSIGPTLLRFAAMHLDDEPETKALLKSLDGVRIRVYEVNGDSDRISRNLQHMGLKLQQDDWDPVMLVNENGELTQMFAKTTARGIQGLTIVSADESEVVVINVMGDIDPSHFKDVMVALKVQNAPEVRIAAAN